MRGLLCVDGTSLDRLLDGVSRLIVREVDWVVVHVVDTRGQRDLGVLRAGVPGAGPLAPRQRAEIEAAAMDRAREVLAAAEAGLAARGLHGASVVQALGEPGREICAVALAERIDVIVLPARRRPGPASGPPSVGRTARFVLDHAPCPVVLLRSSGQRT